MTGFRCSTGELRERVDVVDPAGPASAKGTDLAVLPVPAVVRSRVPARVRSVTVDEVTEAGGVRTAFAHEVTVRYSAALWGLGTRAVVRWLGRDLQPASLTRESDRGPWLVYVCHERRGGG